MPVPVLDGAQGEFYKNMGLENEYTIKSGKYIIPLAELPPTDPEKLAIWKPYAVVQAHSPIRYRRYRYDAEKERNPPVLPKPTDSGVYDFLSGSLTLPFPTIMTDGSMRWKGEVDYLFAEGTNHDAPQNGFVIGGVFDPLAVQDDNASNGYGSSDAPLSITLGGIGPQVGWSLAKNIDLTRSSWTYYEPSYYPAQLLSTDMVCGASQYNYAAAPDDIFINPFSDTITSETTTPTQPPLGFLD